MASFDVGFDVGSTCLEQRFRDSFVNEFEFIEPLFLNASFMHLVLFID